MVDAETYREGKSGGAPGRAPPLENPIPLQRKDVVPMVRARTQNQSTDLPRRLPPRWALIVAGGCAAYGIAVSEGQGIALGAATAVVVGMHQLLE